MDRQRAWVALFVLVGCTASSASSPGSSAPDPSSQSEAPEGDPFEDDADEYEGTIIQEIVECQLWDETCLIRVQDIRHQRQTQAKLDELLRANQQAREEQQQQHEQRLRAINRAAGLDPEAGQGFWCFTGQSPQRSLTECRRTWDECADRILQREREGMTVEGRRCEQYAQAACFQITRTLKEGPRSVCYGDLASCETSKRGLGSQGFVSPPTACRVTD
ncbi:MAG: hypothetical protein AAGF11_44670 [Myxococcota bacterium]